MFIVNTYIFESLSGLILLVLFQITSLCHFPRSGRVINGMKILLPGHLERILPALVHGRIDNDVVAAVRRIGGNALSSIQGLRSIILLDLVYEMKLLRVGTRLLVMLRPLGSGFALCAFFAWGDSWLSWDRQSNRVLQACVLDTRLMRFLILTIVELVGDLRKGLFLILRRCFYLNYNVSLGGVIVDHVGERVLDADGHGGHRGGLPTVVLRPEVLHGVVSVRAGHELVLELLLLFVSPSLQVAVNKLVHH
jgi:hypothetical protein